MSRPRVLHRCGACGAQSARWTGRCATCGEWNTVGSERPPDPAPRLSSWHCEDGRALPLSEVDPNAAVPIPTGVGELDRVLGGGLAPGSVTLVGGEPGVGKSTLLLQVLGAVAGSGASGARRRGARAPVLLVSAEESPAQVRLRAERLGPPSDDLLVLAQTELEPVLAAIEAVDPALVVVDSIQTVVRGDVAGVAGSLTQVRACAESFVALAKSRQLPVVLVSHVTKEGALAGPRALEHVVDTVLTLEGDRHHALRLLRAVKHRFGPTGEVGLFEMGEAGLVSVADPHQLLLGDRRPGAVGSVVLPALEGNRAVLVELQALAARAAPGAPPRRSAQGLDPKRLTLVLAVLASHTPRADPTLDVFASVVGGIRVAEPAADLALVTALGSALGRVAPAPDLVVFGEVGLGGELRQVPHPARRLSEAARAGFRRALVPASCPDTDTDLELLRVPDVTSALGVLEETGSRL